MEFVISRPKLLRRLLLGAGIMTVWMGSMDLGMVWLFDLRRLHGTSGGCPHGVAVLLTVFWGMAVIVGVRRQLRSGFTLQGRQLTQDSQKYELAGPSYLERRSLIVTTRSGPLDLPDVYERSLPEIRDRLNLAWSNGAQKNRQPRGPALPRSGISEVDSFAAALVSDPSARPIIVKDHGPRWLLSPGWIPFLLLVLMVVPFLINPGPPRGREKLATPVTLTERIQEAELFRNTMVALFAAWIAIPWILLTVKQPTRRYHRWMLVSPGYLIVSDTTVRIIPTEAVSEVGSVPGRVWSRELGIGCHVGTTWRFPDLGLEREVAIACGQDPDQVLPLSECAARLGCSRIRAWLLTFDSGGIRTLAGNLRRAEFERQFPDLRARVHGPSGRP